MQYAEVRNILIPDLRLGQKEKKTTEETLETGKDNEISQMINQVLILE